MATVVYKYCTAKTPLRKADEQSSDIDDLLVICNVYGASGWKYCSHINMILPKREGVGYDGTFIQVLFERQA